MPVKRRKSEEPSTSTSDSAPEMSTAATWTAPSPEVFKGLRRYKSFLLPPNNSYALGQYVWLAHEGEHSSYRSNKHIASQPPTIKKSRSSTVNSSILDGQDANIIKGPLDKIHEEEFEDSHWDADLWIGKIVEIRARDTSYVWMRIRWACKTISELVDSGTTTGLPKKKIADKEIFLLGEEHDAIQPVGAVESAAPVIVFDERNPVQAPFGYNKIFLRNEARTPTEEEVAALAKKRISGNVEPRSKKRSRPSEAGPGGHLFPLRKPTCYCGDPYRPLSEYEEPMALCSHKDCLRWFHLGCLDWKNDHRRTATASLLENVRTSGLELMTLLPEYGLHTEAAQLPLNEDPADLDFDLVMTKDKILPTSALVMKKPSSGQNINSKALNEHGETNGNVPVLSPSELEELGKYDRYLPDIVLRVAESAVIRGTRDTGIVGNARYILRAREIIKENRRIRKNASENKNDIQDHLNDMRKVGMMIEEWKEIWEIAEDELGNDTTKNDGLVKKEKNDNGVVKKEKNDNLDDEEGIPNLHARPVLWLCPHCRKAM